MWIFYKRLKLKLFVIIIVNYFNTPWLIKISNDSH